LNLQATCDERKGFAPMEIIELPVVLIELCGAQVVDEFRTFVRPTVHPVLTDFCRELTGISQEQVDVAPDFPEALMNLNAWLASHGFGPEGTAHNSSGARSVMFVCDGDWDLRSMMPKQCILSEVEMPQVLHRWIDVRKVFQESMRTGQDAGLLKMCQALGIRFVGQAHSGIADARNIARVALVLIQEYPALLLSTSQIKGLKVSEVSLNPKPETLNPGP
ncbi:ribonuclease H-like domain-containing protein, partial [Baffinella frigidus]